MNSLVETERTLRHIAEQRADGFYKIMMELAEGYCSDALDPVLKRNKDAPRLWSVKEWHDFISKNIRVPDRLVELQDQMHAELARAKHDLDQALGQCTLLKEEKKEIRRRYLRLQETVKQQKKEINRLQALLAASVSTGDQGDVTPMPQHKPTTVSTSTTSRSSATDPVPIDDDRTAAAWSKPERDKDKTKMYILRPIDEQLLEKGWRIVPELVSDQVAKDQKDQTMERGLHVLQIIGHRGMMATPELKSFLRKNWEVKPGKSDTSLRRRINKCVSTGLITTLMDSESYNNRPARVYILTDRGKEVYSAIWNQPPNEDLMLSMKEHGGEQALKHTILLARAAAFLELYQDAVVDVEPPALYFDEHVFRPDLIAWVPDGQNSVIRKALYIECERVKQSLSKRKNKWYNAYRAGEGTISVVCPTTDVRRHTVEQIENLLGNKDNLNLQATDIERLAKGDYPVMEGFWV